MSQHQWPVSYESCHRLPIRWIVTTQNTILHFISRFDGNDDHTLNEKIVQYILSYCYLTITQYSKPLLPWWLPSQPWSSPCQVSQPPRVSSCNFQICQNAAPFFLPFSHFSCVWISCEWSVFCTSLLFVVWAVYCRVLGTLPWTAIEHCAINLWLKKLKMTQVWHVTAMTNRWHYVSHLTVKCPPCLSLVVAHYLSLIYSCCLFMGSDAPQIDMVLTDWTLQILTWLACQTSSPMRISTTTWMCVFTQWSISCSRMGILYTILKLMLMLALDPSHWPSDRLASSGCETWGASTCCT